MEFKVGDLLIPENEVRKAISDAKRLWKADKREITYTDELTPEEVALVSEDTEAVMLAWQRRQIELSLIARVDKILSEHRNPPHVKAKEKAVEEGVD